MEERRLLLAVALSLLVLTAYQMLFPSAPPQPRPTPSAVAPSTLAPSAPAPTPPAAETSRRSARPSPRPTATPAVPRVQDERERRVEVQSPGRASLAFSNRGARLISWQLERFRDGRGRPEEMVQTLQGGPRPLDLETGEPDLDQQLREALFVASSDQLALERGSELTFRYSDGGVEAEKSLRAGAEAGLIAIRARVRRDGRELPVKLVWGPGLGNPSAQERDVQGYYEPQVVYLGAKGVERIPVEKVGPQQGLPPAGWVGVESPHFAALWVPPAGALVEARAVALPPGEDGKPRQAPVVAVALPSATDAVLLYVGPKDHATLKQAGHELAQVVQVGEWIGPIVLAMMRLLAWVQSHVGNYGWSIVVLTVLINMAMAPLRHYGIANGRKMAKLAPEMRVIQERYRKVPMLDPRRQDMQQEIAELYARHGMSMSTQMLVGCLPILLTMPFLVAFYRVLTVAIELRGASFLWIADLSQKDPYFLTPILMGASMFLMTKMTPTTMDPAQQRIMLLMPVVFSGMFLWAPAGLNLYWLVSNLCSIVQQGVTLKLLNAREEREEPKKERRR